MSGNLPLNWETWRLEDVGEWSGGGTPSSTNLDFWHGDIPWVSPKDMKVKCISSTQDQITLEAVAQSAAKLIPPSSVLFVTRSGILSHSFPVATTQVEVTVNQDLKAITPVEVIDHNYLAYLLRASERKILSTCSKHGTTVHSIEIPALKALEVPIAPLPEQRRIVAKIEELFSELDKGVESLLTAREQLKAYRQSVLKHAFEGKLTADWRAKNPEKLHTPEDILSLIRNAREARYQDSMQEWRKAAAMDEESGVKVKIPSKPVKPEWPSNLTYPDLPDLPEGWQYVPFEALANSIRNGISKKPEEEGGLKIFRISAVRPMAFDMTDYRLLDDNEDYYAYKLRRGDLVFTRYNGSRSYVGVAALFRSDEDYVYPDKLIRCDIASNVINGGYLEKAVNCGESRAFMESRIRTTAGQAGISGGDLKAMPVPICSPEEQLEINRLLELHLSQVVRLEADVEVALQKAQSLRQTILKRAFAGELVNSGPENQPASDAMKSMHNKVAV